MYNGRTYQKDQGEDKIARNYVPPDDGLPTPLFGVLSKILIYGASGGYVDDVCV